VTKQDVRDLERRAGHAGRGRRARASKGWSGRARWRTAPRGGTTFPPPV